MLGLAMAPAAIDGRIHVPVVDEFFPKFPLRGAGRRFPIQVGDLVEWTQMILRGSMALETPTHAVGLGVVDDFHVVDLTVAGDATDTSVYVNRMVEIDVIRSFVNPDPGDGIAGFPGFADGG